MADALAALRGDFSRLGSRLGTVVHSATCPLSNVTIRAHFPTFKYGSASVYELARAISLFLTHFTLHRTECDAVDKLFSAGSVEDFKIEHARLIQKARDTFKKAHQTTERNGEAGELLLFLLTEWILEAPQILAKMSLKTNRAMPVHGSDGIHARYDESRGELVFLFGESKVHASRRDALYDAAKSIDKALKPSERDYEINLVVNHLPLSGLSPDAREAILEYLHPFSPRDKKVSIVITGLVCYNEPAYARLTEGIEDGEREAEFQNTFAKELQKIADTAAKALVHHGVSQQRIELFLLPLPSVGEFRDYFQDEIGWKR